ncbi:intraflagellar transport protein 81 homolog isoform X1 [Agrilus planipennis]|uniref:Intraflagellar transport protein 81 homolog isoform X1 n=1 Tax=Agrilus planipennis TaxID=224129 RepID=A0A1W4WH59_AGRPL|nr:intraflagellar transport protein 81 homolog isoform X1 [Agrilus planipennis]
MNEELKLVINKLNTLLATDLNIISINSLSDTELLQLVIKVLHHLGICSLVGAEENKELTVFVILESLRKIKYVPPSEISPELFRDGLLNGNFKIIIQLLFWLLQNETEIGKRAYLSKYVEKIDIPLETLSDANVQEIYQQYESKIEEFWKTYSLYKREKKNEEETVELKKDIERMDFDLQKLIQRTNSQKEKVESMADRDMLLTLAKAYTKETMEEKKLQEQLMTQQTSLNQIENQIKILNESISKRKISEPIRNKPLEYLESDFQTNKLLAEEELPKEYEKLNLELGLLETVLNEPEPIEAELEMLSEEVEKLQLQIQSLSEQKLSLVHSNNDILRPYQNQATAIENKKQQLTKTVIEKKEYLNKLNKTLTEKQDKLVSYVGGPVLHGDELRSYVSKLRELSVTYKEKKTQLQGLFNELGIVSRTYEILNVIDPNIQKIVKEKEEQDKSAEDTAVPAEDEHKLKTAVFQLAQEADRKQAEAKQIKEELANLKQEIQTVNEKYQNAKENFQRITGYAVDELEKLRKENDDFEEEIRKLEEKWKLLRREIDRKEELLLRLSEDMINSADDDNVDGDGKKEPTQLEKLENKLHEKEKQKRELALKKQALHNKKDQVHEQMEIINGIVHILNCKQKLLNQ